MAAVDDPFTFEEIRDSVRRMRRRVDRGDAIGQRFGLHQPAARLSLLMAEWLVAECERLRDLAGEV